MFGKMKQSHVAAHEHSSRHKLEIEQSELCGCFYCIDVFPPSEIEDWIDDGVDDTALCPRCGIDAVIGSASSYPIEKSFLRKMHSHWF